MSKTQVNLVLFLGLLISVTADVDISKIFTICKAHDPNLNECLKGSIQDALLKMSDGIKELNTPPMDPLFIKEVKVPAGSGSVHVDQTYTNMKVSNLGRSSIVNFVKAEVKPDGFEIDLDLFSKEYKLEADYKFDGKILVISIKAEGKCVILLDDIESQAHVVGETYTRDGKIYGSIKSIKIDFLPKKVKFQFDNVLNNDSVLNREVNALLNEKWEDVFHDVKDNYAKVISDYIIETANKIFHNVEFNAVFTQD